MPSTKNLTQEISPRKTAKLTIPVFITVGSIVALLGYVLGIFISQSVGFPAPYEFAGLVGYEAAALFAGMFIAAITSLGLIFFWLKSSSLRPGMMISYTLFWIIALFLLQSTDQMVSNTVYVYVLAPLFLVSILITILLSRKN